MTNKEKLNLIKQAKYVDLYFCETWVPSTKKVAKMLLKQYHEYLELELVNEVLSVSMSSDY